jgi:hypothetical protein
MAQINFFQTQPAQVQLPYEGYVAMYYASGGQISFLNSTGSVYPTFSGQVVSASVAELASNFTAGNKTINGNLVVTGSITAQTYIISSSVINQVELFSSGSTIFGNDLTDTHQFSGSLSVTGSTLLKGNVVITGSTTFTPQQNNAALVVSGALTIGGAQLIDYLHVQNTHPLATNNKKHFRLNSTGSAETLNAAYSTVIHSLSDTGNGFFAGALNVSKSLALGSSLTDAHSITGSLNITGSSTLRGGTIIGGAIGNTHQITGSTGATGSLTVVGTFNMSGSTAIGNSLNDIHRISGSVGVTGSFQVAGPGTAIEFQVTATGSKLGTALTDLHNISGSVGISGSLRVTGSGITGSLNGTIGHNYFSQGVINSNFSVPAGSDTVIPFQDEYDPSNWWNTSTYRCTPTIAGYYQVAFGAWLEESQTGSQTNAQARKNGSTIAIVQYPTSNAAGQSLAASKIVALNGTTDYVDFTIYQSTAVSRNIKPQGTWFTVNLLYTI